MFLFDSERNRSAGVGVRGHPEAEVARLAAESSVGTGEGEARGRKSEADIAALARLKGYLGEVFELFDGAHCRADEIAHVELDNL